MPRSKLQSKLYTALVGAALGLVVGGVGRAQTAPAPAPMVTVHVGPALAAKARKLGQTDVDEMAKSLADTVRGDLQGHSRANAPIRADLTLEDANPNRPTLQELYDHPGLSMDSVALGGAAISGVVTFADGHTESVSYSFRQDFLRDDIGVGQWTDAERTFQLLGDDLAHGHIPHDRLDVRVADSDADPWRP